MIQDDLEYEVTKEQAEKFERALAQLIARSAERSHVHPRLREAEEVTMQTMIDRLRAELRDYEARHHPQLLRQATK